MSAIGPAVSSALRESFSISVVSRAELTGCAPWASTFTDQRKDHRYYEILDDTLRGNFEHRYFAIVDRNDHVRAVQPFFLVDQDILEGLGAERIDWIASVRRFYPRFLKLRTLMVGCSAGEAHRAQGISFSLSQNTSLLPAMRLRTRAEHADDDARHRI